MALSKAELVKRYASRAPRYTSYPTAPNFTEDLDQDELLRRWREADADLSLYLHLPYCVRRCLFCGCHTHITTRRDRGSGYVDTLIQELELYAGLTDYQRPMRQLALGGGTPNFLLPEDMRRLMGAVEGHFTFAADAERSIECDPRTITSDYVAMLLELGFNRFSFGVQDLHEPTMAAVNRPQSEETVESVIAAVRRGGEVPVNIDLIYGLPLQTEESWRRTIERVIELSPERLAVYGYAHLPQLIRHQKGLTKLNVPDDALRASLQRMAREMFSEAGYDVIGFDHYAKPSDELARAQRGGSLHRNFMGYTTRKGLDILAAGVSAIGSMNDTYTQVAKDEAAWRQAVEAGVPPWGRGFLLSPKDAMRRELILQLSCNLEADLGALGPDGLATFRPELDGLASMFEDDLIELDGTVLRVKERGRPFVRNLCARFDQYLGDGAGGFSRTS